MFPAVIVRVCNIFGLWVCVIPSGGCRSRGINAERFSCPEQSPILAFSARLAENPGALKLRSHRPSGSGVDRGLRAVND